MKIVLWICRILVGVTFIFSGLVKADDPLGSSYKMHEYFEEVFHLGFLIPYSLPITIILIVLELVLGVIVIFGIRMNIGSWLLMLLTVYFGFLTGYSAWKHLVEECGCFGDFIKLTQWQSFLKNLVLLALIAPIFWKRKEIKPLFKKEKINNWILTTAVFLSASFTVYCYEYLPVWDFRPYAIGQNIKENMKTKKAAVYLSVMAYKNKSTGEVEDNYVYAASAKDSIDYVAKGFKILPWRDSVWNANHAYDAEKTPKPVVIDEGIPAKITDFALTDDSNGGKNVTDSILNLSHYAVWIITYDVKEAGKNPIKKIEALSKELEKNGVSVFGFTASPKNESDLFRQENNLTFPFYSCDGKVLQTMIRSNPGLMLVKDGTVINMWSRNGIPSMESLKKDLK